MNPLPLAKEAVVLTEAHLYLQYRNIFKILTFDGSKWVLFGISLMEAFRELDKISFEIFEFIDYWYTLVMFMFLIIFAMCDHIMCDEN